RSHDVQPFPTAAHAHQARLSDQQQAAVQQLDAPDRMARIDEVASGLVALRLLLLSFMRLEELLLLGGIRLPEKTGGLVITDADALEEVAHAARRVGDVKGLLDPVTDGLGGQEATGSDLGLEMV